MPTADLVECPERNAGLSGQSLHLLHGKMLGQFMDGGGGFHNRKVTSCGNVLQGVLLPSLRISEEVTLSFNGGMDKQEIRRKNLRQIVEDKFENKSVRLASHVERPHPNISQLLSGSRPFGEKLARALEKDLELPEMWLDQDRSQDLSDQATEAAKKLDAMSEKDRAELLWLIDRVQALSDFNMDYKITLEIPKEDGSKNLKESSG
jgi:plasmid maintenance system antidote protein VapI